MRRCNPVTVRLYFENPKPAEGRMQNMLHQECRIANLSSSVATVRFSRNERLKSGAVIALAIAVPNTIMRVETDAEIMWARHRFNDLIGGIKLTYMLSDNMIQQLVKKAP